MKMLSKSDNKVLTGVCGGIAEYLDCDPMLIRMLWVMISLFAGAGIIVYLVAVVLMPERKVKYD